MPSHETFFWAGPLPRLDGAMPTGWAALKGGRWREEGPACCQGRLGLGGDQTPPALISGHRDPRRVASTTRVGRIAPGVTTLMDSSPPTPEPDVDTLCHVTDRPLVVSIGIKELWSHIKRICVHRGLASGG